MSKNKEHPEQTLVVNINLTRGAIALLTLSLAVVVFLGYLAWGGQEAAAAGGQASPTTSTGIRQYYLTDSEIPNATSATSACADGYHMASLWEILDPSNLKYNTSLGHTRGDSGSGPPSTSGWVRTGYQADNSDVAGRANCSGWTTTTGDGTQAWPAQMWDPSSADIHGWNALAVQCTDWARVWCVED